MKLSVSNIAWDIEEEQEIFELLHANGVSGIEIAPTKIWPAWHGANPENAAQIRNNYAEKSFKIPALQAILFDKPELQIFGSTDSREKLLEHLANVAALSEAFNSHALVFGSPKNRDPGTLSADQAFSQGVEFFQRAAEVCAKHKTQLCLEANPKVYNCRFMTHWHETFEMVKVVSSPGLGIHLDTACISLEGDDVVSAIKQCAGKIAHFHISEPNLSDFSAPKIDHAAIGQALKDINYNGWLSIEMRRSYNPLKSVEEAVQRVSDWYL